MRKHAYVKKEKTDKRIRKATEQGNFFFGKFEKIPDHKTLHADKKDGGKNGTYKIKRIQMLHRRKNL